MSEHVVDAEVVDETALVPAPVASPLFRATDPPEVVNEATKVADSLADVIEKRELYSNIRGKKHVRVEGWQLLGSMLGVTAVCTETVPVEGGYRATVEARTVDGRVVGRADALCTKAEKSGPWSTADDFARLSMAQTRATSKALKGPLGFVVSLAGYATTPSEEMGPEEAAPVSSPAATGEQLDVLTQAVNFLLPEDRAVALWDRIKEISGGEITATAALVAIAVCSAKRKAEGQGPSQGAGAGADGDHSPGSSSARAESAPPSDPAPAASVEDELPADTKGLL